MSMKKHNIKYYQMASEFTKMFIQIGRPVHFSFSFYMDKRQGQMASPSFSFQERFFADSG